MIGSDGLGKTQPEQAPPSIDLDGDWHFGYHNFLSDWLNYKPAFDFNQGQITI
jgi:hypothetical protein